MDPQRWKLIQEIFYEALACDETARNELLRERCQNDATLREEIQSLISCHETPAQLWEHDRFDLGLELLVMDEDLHTDKDFGNYTLKRFIGRGGMGDVYLACDKTLGRHVALKFLPRSLSLDNEWSLRFHEEARAASSIAHPNVAHIYELGNSDGREYIAMEFIDGVTARDRLKRGPFDLSEAIEIGEQVGRGIAAAHSVGVLHRDIKPENIMLAADGFVKVLDFGLAKASRTNAPNNHYQTVHSYLTSPGVIMGTAAYMSPEQLRGQPTDARTDVWSLGVTLYELISGRQPFPGQTYGEIRSAVLFHEFLPLRILGGNHAAGRLVADILKRALRKNKEDRYQRVEEFVNDLKRVKLMLNQAYSASLNDHTTGAHLYPQTPAFQRTIEFAETDPVIYEHKKERILTLSIFLLTSVGFFGILLATSEIEKTLYRLLDVRDSSIPNVIHPLISVAASLLGGFAVARVAPLMKTSWSIRYALAIFALIFGYGLFFTTFHWMPSLGVYVIYSLPYLGAAVAGASLVFRPWTVFQSRRFKGIEDAPQSFRLPP